MNSLSMCSKIVCECFLPKLESWPKRNQPCGSALALGMLISHLTACGVVPFFGLWRNDGEWQAQINVQTGNNNNKSIGFYYLYGQEAFMATRA